MARPDLDALAARAAELAELQPDGGWPRARRSATLGDARRRSAGDARRRSATLGDARRRSATLGDAASLVVSSPGWDGETIILYRLANL